MAIVAAVIGLAHNFGMTCIAEGIETDAQLSYLAERGVQGQGYLLGRPGEGSVIGDMLGRGRVGVVRPGLRRERRTSPPPGEVDVSSTGGYLAGGPHVEGRRLG